MATVITTKNINMSQLSNELGVRVDITDQDGAHYVTADVEQAVLQAAVDAHVAVDEEGNRALLEQQAATATAGNRNFLAIAAPTNAQTLAQVKALTRQNNGIIRLLLNDLDATD